MRRRRAAGSPTAPRRARRSASSPAPARWPWSAAATTCCPRTSRRRARTCCATASCSPTTRWPTVSRSTTSSPACSQTVPLPQVSARPAGAGRARPAVRADTAASPARAAAAGDARRGPGRGRHLAVPAATAGWRPALAARLELSVRTALDGLLQGNHLGLVPGPGTEPGEPRPYQPGDDVRRMDWSVTARTTEPHVRETVADRELETWLVVDLSPSLDFGTAACEKRDLAIAALRRRRPPDRRRRQPHRRRRRHRASATVRLPARGGRAARPRACCGGSRATAARAGGHPRRPRRRRSSSCAARRAGAGSSVVISDFLGERRLGARAARPARHATSCWRSRSLDPRELELPDVGTVVLADPETGAPARGGRPRRCCAASSPRRPPRTGSGSRRRCAARVRRTCACAPTPTGSPTSSGSRVARKRGWSGGRRPVSGVFTDPWWLAGAPGAVAALAVAYVLLLRRRRRRHGAFTNLALLDRVAPRRPGWRRHVPAAACSSRWRC